MTVATVITGQVKHIRTTVEQPWVLDFGSLFVHKIINETCTNSTTPPPTVPPPPGPPAPPELARNPVQYNRYLPVRPRPRLHTA